MTARNLLTHIINKTQVLCSLMTSLTILFVDNSAGFPRNFEYKFPDFFKAFSRHFLDFSHTTFFKFNLLKSTYDISKVM